VASLRVGLRSVWSRIMTSPLSPAVTGAQLDALPDVLNVEEAAALLRINSKTLREAIARGEIPGVRRIGRVIRLSRAALLDWLRGKPVT
jgi:excisionase family DNA binding protein